MKRPSWLIGLIATLASFAVLAPFASAVDEPATTAAQAGALWLTGQINSDGFVPSSTSSTTPDYTATMMTALAIKSADRADADADRALDFLAANVEAAIAPGGVDDPGRISWLIMAARADGRSVTNFGGVDLVARLQATMQTTGTDAGLFGSTDPTYDGVFRQSLALDALKAAGITLASTDPAIVWLVGQRCDNGAWMTYRADTTVPCPPSDPTTVTGPDTNSTAMASMALKNHNLNSPYATWEWLASARNPDGAYPYIPGMASDPNSTALVIQTLIRNNRIDDPLLFPTDEYAGLVMFQLGCDAPEADRGAFYYPGSSAANLLATVAAIPALMGQRLPLDLATIPSGELLPLTCETTTTTTSTTTTSTTTTSTTTTTTEPTTTTSTTTTTEPTTTTSTTTTTEPTTTTSTTTTTEPTTTTSTTTTTEPTTTTSTTTTEPTSTTTTTDPTSTTTEPTSTTSTTDPSTTTSSTTSTTASVLGSTQTRSGSTGSTATTSRSTTPLATTGRESLRWTLVALASLTLGMLTFAASRRAEQR